MIPYGRQWIDDEDIAAVVDVLKGDWLTTGPHVREFEEGLAARVEARHAVVFANGTAALHAACAVSGIGPGDVVVTSPLSFVASANCARYVGAEVQFADIRPETLNLDPSLIGSETGALVAVHFAGLPLDLELLPARPPVVIEDAAHALGALTPDGPVGNCARSDLCCFSFHPVKAITTGEGGAVTTNDDSLAEALRLFRNHGMVRRPDQPEWRYDVPGLGFNYRLTDFQAALGTSQLRKLDRFISRRQELAQRYRVLLADEAVALPPAPPPGFEHAYHLFPVEVSNRDRVYGELRARGVGAQVHYLPINQLEAFSHTAATPIAADVAARLLSLPLHPQLTERDQDIVVTTLRAALR